MKKEWLKHYVLAFAFLGLIVVSILMLFSQIRLAGFAVYGANEACEASVTDNSYFTASQTCDTPTGLGGSGITGPTITTNNVVLNCSSNSLTGGNDGFGIKTIANNSIIKNCPISSFIYNLNISSENTTIIDTRIQTSAT